jgi:hypothetical protein
MMEETSTSETSVNFYQTTRRNNPEGSHLHTRRRENLKSQQGAITSILSQRSTLLGNQTEVSVHTSSVISAAVSWTHIHLLSSVPQFPEHTYIFCHQCRSFLNTHTSSVISAAVSWTHIHLLSTVPQFPEHTGLLL